MNWPVATITTHHTCVQAVNDISTKPLITACVLRKQLQKWFAQICIAFACTKSLYQKDWNRFCRPLDEYA